MLHFRKLPDNILYDVKFSMIKVCNYKLLTTAFTYNYVILKSIVFIFLDLKQIATVCSRPSKLLRVERTGMLIIDSEIEILKLRILTEIELYLYFGFPKYVY